MPFTNSLGAKWDTEMTESIDALSLLRVANEVRASNDSPPICPLQPGLDASEVRSLVMSLAPSLVYLIDDTIETWWSGHNGAILGRVGEGTVPVVAPDGFSLSALDRLLRQRAPHTNQDRGPVHTFPISHDEMGTRHWLTKTEIEDPWYIEMDSENYELVPPHLDPDGEAVLFSDYYQWAMQATWLPRERYSVEGIR